MPCFIKTTAAAWLRRPRPRHHHHRRNPHARELLLQRREAEILPLERAVDAKEGREAHYSIWSLRNEIMFHDAFFLLRTTNTRRLGAKSSSSQTQTVFSDRARESREQMTKTHYLEIHVLRSLYSAQGINFDPTPRCVCLKLGERREKTICQEFSRPSQYLPNK